MEKNQLKLMNVTETSEYLGLSSTTFWRIRQKGLFPKPISSDGVVIGWPKKEIDNWVHDSFASAQS
ncbi:helix-turn-helix transcriptional regulator [Vibrio superstes]|uniref:Uncharacterized protein n=1 Tax=Vibrio superstes NBRC 103154 TaxID=1219062 RepID=A0A511QMH0_9VIBR|nr:AlpA family phage regulatory protein [Vibrio superstes]GEM78520.1 hypothetical protein VSU01S_07650 [Vibrio superstes NBRC 103154]